MWKWIFVFPKVTLKAFKTLGDIVRCLYQTFSFDETLPLNHLLVPPSTTFIHFYTASIVSGSLGCHLVPANAHLPLTRLFLYRYESWRRAYIGACTGHFALGRLRKLQLWYALFRPKNSLYLFSGFRTPPFPEKIILEEVEGHFTSQIANKLTGGPSAPGLPGKPGFPVGPWRENRANY